MNPIARNGRHYQPDQRREARRQFLAVESIDTARIPETAASSLYTRDLDYRARVDRIVQKLIPEAMYPYPD